MRNESLHKSLLRLARTYLSGHVSPELPWADPEILLVSEPALAVTRLRARATDRIDGERRVYRHRLTVDAVAVRDAWEATGVQAFDDAILVRADAVEGRLALADVWQLTGIRQPRLNPRIVTRFGAKARDGSLVVGRTAAGADRMRDTYDRIADVRWDLADFTVWSSGHFGIEKSPKPPIEVTITNVGLTEARSASEIRVSGVIRFPGERLVAVGAVAMPASDGRMVLFHAPETVNQSTYFARQALEEYEESVLRRRDETYVPTEADLVEDAVLAGGL
ncbi:hypothetical protein GCM10011390_02600 [Aureimonas endophytica]|uniref:Uncharacterized protein n=1 Tax=Aureimonas endophytica TaxID=2027858 RepID=A0A916ZDA0_9HYPH|nr:hypothetical protein [Aureimonas endophytica]GGD87361.1 hypothetical protein GCM10011390_02600 [Aureimonas endophytica]